MNMKKIMSVTLAVSLMAASVQAKTISELKKESTSVRSQISTAQSNLDATNTQKAEAQSEIQKLDNELATVQAEIQNLENQLNTTKANLARAQQELEEAIEIKNTHYDALKERIRVMYKSGNTGYLEVVLGAESFSDLLNRFEYSNKIMEYDRELLSKYQKAEETIANNVVQIEEDKKTIENLQSQSEAKKAELNTKIEEKNKLVLALDQDAESYQAQIAELQQQDANVQNLIRQAEQKQKEEAAAAARASTSSSSSYTSTYNRGSSSNTVYSSDGKHYQYPIPAYAGYKPNSGYGYRSSPISGSSEFHTGVDLKATLNTDVVAAESGTVIYAGWRGGYGKTVIVDHGGSYSTLYAHNNEIKCSVGQQVSRGQVIAGAGTTGYSTGVHSHFEVRINGSHTNPTGYIY